MNHPEAELKSQPTAVATGAAVQPNGTRRHLDKRRVVHLRLQAISVCSCQACMYSASTPSETKLDFFQEDVAQSSKKALACYAHPHA
jgi:hypothetical protein